MNPSRLLLPLISLLLLAGPILGQEAAAGAAPVQEAGGFMQGIDDGTGVLNGWIGSVFFYPVPLGGGQTVPLAVAWLILGAIFLTFRMGFISLRGVGHAVRVTAGKYTSPSAKGDVSHFQALSTALSATVGLGNIAGVAIAISIGGPGAMFWMTVAGFLGMTSKMVECTLGQRYREIRPDGRVMGGAMFYLSKGLKEMGWGRLGKFLAVMFAILCIGGSFGGGNTFQVSQSLNAVQETIPFLKDHRWVYGLFMAIITGIVIIGGIKRIATVADKIVPLMCGTYVLACLAVLFMHLGDIPAAFSQIWHDALTLEAGYGGLIGTLVVGFQRAAFSNEAGVGSAAIAHSAARTDQPVREGIVALLEPFIDTIIICNMTAVVIILTGAWSNPDYESFRAATNGAGLTSAAFGEHLSFFPYVLSFAVFLFAYSTMISWSYYGERCWAYLFGEKWSLSYKILFLVFTFFGAIVTSQNILDFGDLMILGMAFPNMLGIVMLSGKVRQELTAYWAKLKEGSFPVYK